MRARQILAEKHIRGDTSSDSTTKDVLRWRDEAREAAAEASELDRHLTIEKRSKFSLSRQRSIGLKESIPM